MKHKPHLRPASPEDARIRSRPPVWRRLATVLGMTLLAMSLWMFGADRRGADAPAWGDEAAQADTSSFTAWLPLVPANACGLGASSCFKCHNGKRAGLPGADPAKAPWHAQHAKVNNSCTGCHNGNPRVMKEDVAHTKMIAKPRDDSAGTCVGCHSSDIAKVKDAYTRGAK